MKTVFTIGLFFIITNVIAQTSDIDKTILAGNEFYKKQQYEQAVNEYLKAMTIDASNIKAKFNYANALYKAGKQVEASKTFTELTNAVTEKELRAQTYYNKGVILSAQKNLEESIEQYKHSLRQNPADVEALENMQKSLLELKKKTPPEQKK